jgi:hypothetical protein
MVSNEHGRTAIHVPGSGSATTSDRACLASAPNQLRVADHRQPIQRLAVVRAVVPPARHDVEVGTTS